MLVHHELHDESQLLCYWFPDAQLLLYAQVQGQQQEQIVQLASVNGIALKQHFDLIVKMVLLVDLEYQMRFIF